MLLSRAQARAIFNIKIRVMSSGTVIAFNSHPISLVVISASTSVNLINCSRTFYNKFIVLPIITTV